MTNKRIEECFGVLGLTRNSSFEEVKETYKDLVNVWHPDRFENRPRLKAKAEEKLKEINYAYEQLSNFYRNGNSQHDFETEYSGSSDENDETFDPWKTEVPSDTEEEKAPVDRRPGRLRLVALIGVLTLIISLSVYLSRSRRFISAELSPQQPTPASNANSNQASQPSPAISFAGAVPLPEPSPSLEEGELSEIESKDARELVFLIDVLDARLSEAWNKENDFGVVTDADKRYFEGADRAVRNITHRLDKLPEGTLRKALLVSALAYKDVGQIRVSAGEDNGELTQRNIVKMYGFENTEPHLWAWRVLEVARAARNDGAVMLGLPEKEYSHVETRTETVRSDQLRMGHYLGQARNTTSGSPISGLVVVDILSVDNNNKTLTVNMSFSQGLCGTGSFSGKLSSHSFSLKGELSSSSQPCGEQSWNMVTICRFGEEQEIRCSYRLIGTVAERPVTQSGSFEVSRVNPRVP